MNRGLYRESFEHDACGIGAIAHLHGKRSHQTLDDALSVLVNLEHRGGKGLERNTGDGAGVLFQVPHRFFRKEAQKEGQLLPDEGDYGVAMLFLPHDDPAGVTAARQVFERGCAECGVPLMFWREVPVDPHDLGSTALNDFTTDKIFEIVDERYRSGKPLIVTTNLNPDEAWKSSIGMRRIFDRLRERCRHVVVDGESRRRAC